MKQCLLLGICSLLGASVNRESTVLTFTYSNPAFSIVPTLYGMRRLMFVTLIGPKRQMLGGTPHAHVAFSD